MKFVASDNQTVHIRENLKGRSFNTHKFYEWLHINENTPIRIKLQVLDACMFMAYVYGSETWYQINDVSGDLLLLERKLLKRIMGVKSNVPDDILYLELDRPDIMSIIRERQYNFYTNLLQLKEDESITRKLMSLYNNLPMFDYYRGLQKDVVEKNKVNRLDESGKCTHTHTERYHHLINLKYNHVVYSFVPEYLRVMITRWRLSNHDLRVETGRYVRPILPRDMRVCSNCTTVVEDEEHALYHCPLYDCVRQKYNELLERYPLVTQIFNPIDVVDACLLGKFLIDIEKVRENLELNIVED